MYVLKFMEPERGAFRQGIVMRFLNILLLVLEPWMAVRIIECISAADFQGILTYAVCFLLIDAGSSLFNYIGTRYVTFSVIELPSMELRLHAK